MDYKQLEKHRAIWWILSYIKKPFLKDSSTNEVILNVNKIHRDTPTAPSGHDQERALEELRSVGVISYQQPDNSTVRGQFAPQYHIAVNQQLFDEWYQRYSEAVDLPTQLRDYLPLVTELKNDSPEEVKRQLELEYSRFIDLEGEKFFQGLARYALFLVNSKSAREIIDSEIKNPEKVSASIKDFNYSLGVAWTGLYRITLALPGKRVNIPGSSDPLSHFGLKLFSEAVNEVFIRGEIGQYANIFYITENNYRPYARELHQFITPKLTESAARIEAESKAIKEGELAKQVEQKVVEQTKNLELALAKSQQEKPLVALPENAKWKYLKLVFNAPAELEVYYRGKFVGRYTAEFLGFKGRQTQYNVSRAWELLQQLSLTQNKIMDLGEGKKITMQARRKIIAESLKVSLDNLDQIRGQLEDRLHRAFGITEGSSFKDTKGSGFYETEFTLLPERSLRSDLDPEFDVLEFDDTRYRNEDGE